jgi:hypothetical protein
MSSATNKKLNPAELAEIVRKVRVLRRAERESGFITRRSQRELLNRITDIDDLTNVLTELEREGNEDVNGNR